MGNELVEIESLGIQPQRGVGWRERQRYGTRARSKKVDEDKPQGQRHQGCADKPGHGPQPYATQRGGIPQMGNAGDESGKDQRRDDHLDQAEKQVGDNREITGNLSKSRRVADRGVQNRTDHYAQHHTDQNVERQTFCHYLS